MQGDRLLRKSSVSQFVSHLPKWPEWLYTLNGTDARPLSVFASSESVSVKPVMMDYMRTEYRFDYQKARPNRFAGRTKHGIVIEKADGNLSAYSPELPGCVATGKTREQVTRNMSEAIEMHVQGLIEDKNEKDGGVE